MTLRILLLVQLLLSLTLLSQDVSAKFVADETWMNGLGMKEAKDDNPSDNIFETTLSAGPSQVEIDDQIVNVLTYDGQLPGPMIRVKQGDRVIVHFVNNLPFSSTIHWHGVQGNHADDGSQISQYSVEGNGGTFDYDFVAANAGTHWYHSHVNTAHTLWNGMYGAIVVVSEEEAELIEFGVLPDTEGTLILSDITFDDDGNVKDIENVPELEHMNGSEGEKLLVNGKVKPQINIPAGKSFQLRLINTSISRYWRLALPSGYKMLRIGGEDGLIDEAVYEGGFKNAMKMDMPMIMCSSDSDCEDNIFSKFDNKCMMGKMCGKMEMEAIDTGYDEGEILLPPAVRATVVITPPDNINEEMLMTWKDFNRGKHSMDMQMPTKMCSSDEDCESPHTCMLMKQGILPPMCGTMGHAVADRPDIDILIFKTTGPKSDAGSSVEAGTSLKDVDDLSEDDPDTSWMGAQAMGGNRINLMGRMTPTGTMFMIDGFSWSYGMGDTSSVPAAPASQRTASLGDLIEFEIHNHSMMNHPFHLHGFSFQPIEFVKMHHMMGYMERYDYGPLEFLDTFDIPPHTSMIARVRLDDPVGDGSAAGRWLFHCHIAQHAERGMISEIKVE